MSKNINCLDKLTIFTLKNMEFLHEDGKLIAGWTRFIFIQ